LVAEIYAIEFQELGGEVFQNHKVNAIKQTGHTSNIQTSQGDFQTDLTINCAGLYSAKVAQMSQKDSLDVKTFLKARN
jgi:L-2-hydroxyglutarate oxidase